jgi:hypothetical protein
LILKNRFKEEDKILVWSDLSCCAICASNIGCSIHHIDGTISDSVFNSILLCFKHHKIADNFNISSGYKGEKFREKLTYIAFKFVLKSGYTLKERDYIYLEKIKDRIHRVFKT